MRKTTKTTKTTKTAKETKTAKAKRVRTPKPSKDPTIARFEAIKKEHPDKMILFRGDGFFEIFGEDTEKAFEVLGLASTKRAGTPMSGFPAHTLEVNLRKLLTAGIKVAIVEPESGEVSDPMELVKETKTSELAEDVSVESERLVWKDSFRKEQPTATWDVWETECGRYQVVRSEAHTNVGNSGFATQQKRGDGWDILISDPMGRSYAKYFNSLAAALNAVRELHGGRTGLGVGVLDNSKSVLAKAGDRAYITSVNGGTNQQEENVMKIKFQNGINLFKSCGLKNADKWSAKKLRDKINNLPKNADQDEDFRPADEGLKDLFDTLVTAVKEGKEIVITGAPDGEDSAPAAKGKATKEKAAKSKTDKSDPDKPAKTPRTKKESGEGKEVDAFGSRLGTLSAKINAQLSKTDPKSAKDLREATGANAVQGHLKVMIDKGYAKRDKDGNYVLTGKSK